jgi:stage II sporulation protein D
MLTPGLIPQSEPVLRVGIILPEDGKEQVDLILPSAMTYRIETENGAGPMDTGGELQFSATGLGLRIRGNEAVFRHIRLIPSDTAHIAPQSGAQVKNVVAGRGFHWQKDIDVFLPGIIELGNVDGSLILINELPLEHYLMCVATSEMGAKCPPALIESQTITARSWMLANVEQKHVALGMDVCNDDCCQRYQGSTNLTRHSIDGARATSGLVLLSGNTICDARYSKNCGGIMESFAQVWPGPALPYLKVKYDAKSEHELRLPLADEISAHQWIDQDPDCFCQLKGITGNQLKKYLGGVDEDGSYFRWHIVISRQELEQHLRQTLLTGLSELVSIEPIHRGGSGRINRMQISYRDTAGNDAVYFLESEYDVRKYMHPSFLYSSAFYITEQKSESGRVRAYKLTGAGWGHGVGYCQMGALGMALDGYPTEDIVYHYFPGSKLEKIY